MPGWVRMASVVELDAGRAVEFVHDGRIYALFSIDGQIAAVDGLCPHQGGPLADGEVSGSCVTCPWHGWQFDVRTGASPVSKKIKLPVFPVRIEGSDVLVSVP